VDGEFEYNGEFYRLVKQRLSRDTLYVVCFKDQKTKEIHQALIDYVKTFTDKPVDAKSSGKMLTSVIKDYVGSNFAVITSTHGWVDQVQKQSHRRYFISSFCSSIVHPPERA
jgi:hypothetical protein